MFLDKIAQFGIPVVDSHDLISNPNAFVTQIRALEGSEGVIVAWPNGHRVKLKGDWYITRHRAKDKILRENGVIEMLLADKLDDVKAVLDDDTRHQLERFETDFWKGVADTVNIWQVVNQSVRSTHGTDRKAFALADGTQVMDGNLKSAVFRAWDAPDFDWRQAVVDTIAKNISTQTKVDAARGLWGGAKWSYGMTVEAE